jgi:opacity protein-like surface antigen
MARVKMLGLAATAALMSTAAQAADFPPSMPPPTYHQAPIDTAGWYLRGNVGVGCYDLLSSPRHRDLPAGSRGLVAADPQTTFSPRIRRRARGAGVGSDGWPPSTE